MPSFNLLINNMFRDILEITRKLGLVPSFSIASDIFLADVLCFDPKRGISIFSFVSIAAKILCLLNCCLPYGYNSRFANSLNILTVSVSFAADPNRHKDR